jgi:DNA-binding protein HU-beta
VNKQELIEVVAKKCGSSKRMAGDILNTVMEEITDQLKRGNKIVLAGFGTFTVNKKAARQGVNPRNPQQRISIPATTVPKFKAGKTLKQAVKK